MEPHYPPQHIRRRAARRRKQRRVLVFLLFASILTGGWLLGRCADFIRAAAHPGVYAVAVDAGHGGSDTGAEGVIQESDMTAATAAALCALLEQDLAPIGRRARIAAGERFAPRDEIERLLALYGHLVR